MTTQRILTNYGERKEPARELRREQTEAETKLWARLRDRRLCGFKFRRQVPMGPFFADFCCLDERLVVEVDGGQHADSVDQDNNRTHYLIELGFKVIRFWNNEVLIQTDVVCEQILNELKRKPQPPRPFRPLHPLPMGDGIDDVPSPVREKVAEGRMRRP